MVGAEGALQFANGVPGLGSVAFPPSCVPDNEKRKLVGGMARAIEGELAKERGRGVCEAGIARDGEDEEFGVAEIKLREEFSERKDVNLLSIYHPPRSNARSKTDALRCLPLFFSPRSSWISSSKSSTSPSRISSTMEISFLVLTPSTSFRPYRVSYEKEGATRDLSS